MISIIIVHYHVKKELFACIQSIISTKPKTAYEIIIVDNDEEKTIYKELQKRFPKIKYIPNNNKGFGQGNNVGAKQAKGDLLFFLNPDTKIYPKCIDTLATYIKSHKNVGIAAPLLYDDQKRLYPQGARQLTPKTAIFSFSIIHTLFPNNPIVNKYWMKDEWDRKDEHEVASIPGTAFVVRSEVFKKIKGFDERFFMYFEEHDLCKRVQLLGCKIVMLPQAKVYHALGRSAAYKKEASNIFKQSRYYYFKKHFGLFKALLTESILRFSKFTFLFSSVMLVSIVLTVYRLDEFMYFIGDQGWYYLSARDMVVTGAIPLVGIPSSHPWLHQGAFWTYMLGPILWITHFNPISGAYLSGFIHITTLCVLYFICTRMFSEKVGLITSFLYATSPLIIIMTRVPYHTSPIPLLVLILYYSIYKWVKGNPYYFPLIILLLAILYNFEIATFLLVIVVLLIAIFGLWKKKLWFTKTFTKKILILSFLGYFIPMIPMLLFDISHNFPQTLKFLAWVIYKILRLFGFPAITPELSEGGFRNVLVFLAESYRQAVIWQSSLVAFTLAIFSFGFLANTVINQFKTKVFKPEILIAGLIFIVSVIGILATKTASQAYLHVLFPFVFLFIGILFADLTKKNRRNVPIIVLIILGIGVINIYSIVQQNYFITKGYYFSDKVNAAKKIISQAKGREYNLVGRGGGSQFASFTMNYEYLTWWLGNGPSKKDKQLQFVIEETQNGIIITEMKK